MPRLIALVSLSVVALATPATAQVHPFAHNGLSIGERHRYEMDRLQARSDRQDALARQQRLETRLTMRDLQARRQTTPYPAEPDQPHLYGPLRTVEQERALRQAATTGRATTQAGVGQIDAWLDRAPQ